MSERNVRIVTGYHDVTPRNPVPGTVAELPFRLAIVLDSYRPNSMDSVFDADLYCAVVGAVTKFLHADSLASEGEFGGCTSAESFESHYRSMETIDREPPNWIRYIKHGKTIAVCASELWVRVGGPNPYHDSYTMSIFHSLENGDALRAACEEAIVVRGGEIEDRFEGTVLRPA